MDNKLSNIKKTNRATKSKQKCYPVKSEIEQIFEASNDAVRIINSDFTVRYINRAFAEMTGVNQNAVVGKKCWEIFPSPLCYTSECRLQRVLNGEKRVQVEITRHKKDGTIIPCIVTTSPLIDETNRVTGIIEQFRDITEHRRMEYEVKESEERYRALIELGTEAGEAIIMLQDINDKEGIQTFFNDQWPKISGYTKEELIHMSFFDLVSSKDRQASLDRHRKKSSGIPMPGLYEINIIRKDGTEIPIELTGAFTIYNSQRANVVFIRDVTERKKIERRIKESEELYRGLFRDVPVAVIEIDFSQTKKYYDQLRTQGVKDFRRLFFTDQPDALWECETRERITRINNQALCLFETPCTESLRSVSEHKILYPKYFKGKAECHSGLAEGKTYFDYEEEILTEKENAKNVHTWIAVAPGYENSLSRVYVCFVDTTAQKEAEKQLIKSEERFRRLFDYSPVALSEVDYSEVKKYYDELRSHGITNFKCYFENNLDALIHCDRLLRVLRVNTTFLTLWEATNMGSADYIHDEIVNMHKAAPDISRFKDVFIALAEGKTNFDFEESCQTLKGNRQYRYTQVRVAPGCENTLSLVYIAMLDITKRREAEEKLLTYQNHLEDIVKERTFEIEKAKGNLEVLYKSERKLRQEIERQTKQRISFTRALVHELKTPLTPMLGASEILANALENDEVLKHTALTINRGTRNLNKRISELVDITKGEIGLIKLNLKKIDIRLLLTETIEDLLPEAKKQRLDLMLEINDKLCDIRADSDRLQQIISNLVNNAIKFTPPGGRINVIASLRDENLFVEIKDTGCGIKRSKQNQLFQSYRRGVRNEQLSGLGLGLPLSKMLLELHGGHIGFESKEGQGSTFWFMIPIDNK